MTDSEQAPRRARGRPAIDPALRRSKRVCVRLDGEDGRALALIARRVGCEATALRQAIHALARAFEGQS